MKLSRRTIAAVLAVSAMSLCSVPSRGDQYGSTGVLGTSETVTITSAVIGGTETVWTNYQTSLGTSSDGVNFTGTPTTYNTFCVDITHEAATALNVLATPTPPLTSSYSGGSATNPGTANNAFGYAAWLANNYSSTATTADQQAGLQIAIWKLLYETTSLNYSQLGVAALGDGSIQFSPSTYSPGTGPNTLSDAYGYIMDWINHGKQSSSAYLVNYATTDGDHAQYQMIAVPTPEPSTLAIACLGVLGFVGYGLKHRHRRA